MKQTRIKYDIADYLLQKSSIKDLQTKTFDRLRLEFLLRQVREAKENYEFHKSRSEWYEAAKWADVHNNANNVLNKGTN